MSGGRPWVVVGLDNGGTSNNAAVLDANGRYLVDRLLETPSVVRQGPEAAVAALADALTHALDTTGVPREQLRAVGLGTPGPATAEGVISTRGSTNFSEPAWHGFDYRSALESRTGLPVVYNNDGNAAALYAHHVYFGDQARQRSSVSAIVGTGLGGALIEDGRVIKGAVGMGGELGHVHIPTVGLLEEGQPAPVCNCGFTCDAESVASLAGIEHNLLPYWLSRYPQHELAGKAPQQAAQALRSYAEAGDELALSVFEQQAAGLGRLFTIAANFTDPHSFFVGGGVVETEPRFRDWFLAEVRRNTVLRDEQRRIVSFALAPHLDMAGARGAAIAARETVLAGGR